MRLDPALIPRVERRIRVGVGKRHPDRPPIRPEAGHGPADPEEVCMRRYDESINVRLKAESSSPGRFLWRGRIYIVRVVLAHWIEGGAWWRIRDAEGLPLEAPVVAARGRHLWRVEASGQRLESTPVSPGGAAHSSVCGSTGVYDLVHDVTTEPSTWRLGHALD